MFVKTVFSAFQRLDSVPLEIGARTVSLVCQEMFTTRGYFLLEVVSTGLRYLIVPIEEGSGAARIVRADFEELLRTLNAR